MIDINRFDLPKMPEASLLRGLVLKCLDVRCFKQLNLSFIFKYCTLFLVFLFTSLYSFSQTETLPDPINTIFVRTISTGVGSLSQKDNVSKGKEIEFSVPAVIDGVGLPESNEFHWIVYGGTILSVTGGNIEGVVKTYSDTGNVVSEVLAKGWTDGESSLKIKWQDTDLNRGFIAVKQTSEYGCSDDIYSIYYVDIKNVFITLDVMPEADDCANASDNYISYDLTISDHKVDDSWKFKYELRTKNGGEEWSAWLPGSYHAVDLETSPDNGYVVIPAASGNDKYTLNIPVSDALIRGSGDYVVEIRILDVRDGNNCTVLTLPSNDLSVVLHKIPLTDFSITADD